MFNNKLIEHYENLLRSREKMIKELLQALIMLKSGQPQDAVLALEDSAEVESSDQTSPVRVGTIYEG